MEHVATIEKFDLMGKKYIVLVHKGHYEMDPDATALVGTLESGELFATFSVNLAGYGISADEGNVLIKDYSENEGMFEQLVDNGVIGEQIREHTIGPFSLPVREAELLV